MSAEPRRGCGYRKIGGLYLCSDVPGEPCHRLPIPLSVCPTCHAGIKQTRGWTWVKPDLLGGPCQAIQRLGVNLLAEVKEERAPRHCISCPACMPNLLGDKAGLLWIGEQFYKTPAAFTFEAMTMGVSRRISTIPRGFEIGKHWVLLAHPKAVKRYGDHGELLQGDDSKLEEQHKPGIFHVFKPTRIEKILADNTKPQEIEKWEKRGCKVVLLPANDKDHRGTAHDDEEPTVLDLDEVKGVL